MKTRQEMEDSTMSHSVTGDRASDDRFKLTSLPSRMISPRLILEMNCRNLELVNFPSLSAASVSARAFVCSRALAESPTRPPA